MFVRACRTADVYRWAGVGTRSCVVLRTATKVCLLLWTAEHNVHCTVPMASASRQVLFVGHSVRRPPPPPKKNCNSDHKINVTQPPPTPLHVKYSSRFPTTTFRYTMIIAPLAALNKTNVGSPCYAFMIIWGTEPNYRNY